MDHGKADIQPTQLVPGGQALVQLTGPDTIRASMELAARNSTPHRVLGSTAARRFTILQVYEQAL